LKQRGWSALAARNLKATSIQRCTTAADVILSETP